MLEYHGKAVLPRGWDLSFRRAKSPRDLRHEREDVVLGLADAGGKGQLFFLKLFLLLVASILSSQSYYLLPYFLTYSTLLYFTYSIPT